MLTQPHGTMQLLDLSVAPSDVIIRLLESMSLSDRFTCALVCKSWAEAATAATHSIIILRGEVQDLSCFEAWLEKHGSHLEVLQLHECDREALAALPCSQLQDLLMHGNLMYGKKLIMGFKLWCNIAAATKLTSVSLSDVFTFSQQADVVAALTALPDLQQLTWSSVQCSGVRWLSDSLLLQQTTRLTSLELQCITAAALQHLGSLTKLQHLSIRADEDWAAAGCPGLQELKALTSLDLYSTDDIPASISQLTALQQLEVSLATPAAATRLQVLTALTHLKVRRLRDIADQSLQLTGLQHLELGAHGSHDPLPMLFVASCRQFRVLSLRGFSLTGPGSLVASTMLQHLELKSCRVGAAYGAAHPISWQQLFPGPGQLPHLTSLLLWGSGPCLQQSDLESMVAACCSSLQMLHLDTLQDCFAPVLAHLPDLTSLHLIDVTDSQCGALAQLTGLRELRVAQFARLSPIGLRQLAALQQLTSLGFYRGCFLVEAPMLQEWMDKEPGSSHAIVNKVRPCV